MAEDKKLDFSDLGAVPVSKGIDFSDLGAKLAEEAPEEQISNLEAGTRGLMSGAFTPAVNIPIAGLSTGIGAAMGNTKLSLPELYEEYKRTLAENNKREEMSRNQHPLSYYGGMLAGGVASPVGALAEGAELAQGASAGAKIGNAALTGAKMGGLYGAGEALTNASPVEGNADQEIGKAVGTIGKGALGGAVIGGALNGVGQAASGAVNSLAEGNVPLLSKAAQRFQLGTEGVNLYNDKQLAERTAEKFKTLGETGLAKGIDDITDGMDKVLQDAKSSGKKVDYEGVLSDVQDLRTKAEGMEDGDIKDELLSLTGRAKNNINQLKEKITTNTYVKTGEASEMPGSPGTEEVPATPSTRERMQKEADDFNEQQALNEKLNGTPQPKMLVHELDGKIATVIQKPGEAGFATKGQWEAPQEAIPGTPATPGTPGTTVPPTWEAQQQTSLNPDMDPEAAKNARTGFGGDMGKLETRQAQTAEKSIYDGMSEALYKGIPGYEPKSTQYKLFLSAMDDLGLKVKSPSDFFNQSATEMASGAKGTQFNPEVASDLQKTFEKASTDPNVAKTLNSGFEKLQQAGFQGIDQLRAGAEQALHQESLAGGRPAPKSLLSPIGGVLYKGLKAATVAPNIAGLAVNKGLLPTAAGTTNALARTPAAQAIGGAVLNAGQALLGSTPAEAAEMPQKSIMPKSDAFLHKAKDYLGNKRSHYTVQNSTSPQNFSRDLTSASSEQLGPVADVLKSDTNLNYLGTALEKAVQDNNTIQKNAIIFAISQNPAARELLKKGK